MNATLFARHPGQQSGEAASAEPGRAPLLSPLAVKNIDTLQALADPPADCTSSAALARHFNRDKSNFAKTIAALAEEGLVNDHQGGLPALTPAGQAALDAWARAHGAPSSSHGDPAGEVLIPFALIDPWPDQPRSAPDAAFLDDLAQSIGDKGVLQAILVRPHGEGGRYQVIIGETRRAASALAVANGLQPADFRIPCKVRDLSDDEAFELAVVENVQRDDLHWMDEAKALLKLHAMGRSAAQLARIFGNRGKRSIQDYTKIARELPAPDQKRAYLPEGDKNRLTYVQARDLVGEKKAPPVIALPPRSAMTLLELVHAAKLADTTPQGLRIDTLTAKLHAAPSGGPIAALNSHPDGLLTLGFDAGKDMVARIPVTEKLTAWLAQLGYIDHPAEALFKARAVALGGELAASSHPAEFYITPELNPPAQQAPPADPLTPGERRCLREIAARSLHRHRLLDGFILAQDGALEDLEYQRVYDLGFTLHRANREGLEIALTGAGKDHLKAQGYAPQDGLSRNSCTTPWLREPIPPPQGEGDREAVEGASSEAVDPADDVITGTDDGDAEIPAYLRNLAGPGAPAAEPVRPAPPAEPELPAMLAILLVELAHKISTDGHERGPGTWATPLLSGWQDDTRIQKMREHRMLAILPLGERTLGTVTRRGLDWLLANVRMIEAPAGKPNMTDAALAEAQERMIGLRKADAPLYSTPWLSTPPGREPEQSQGHAPAAAASEDAGDAVARPTMDEADRDTASVSPASDRIPSLSDTHRALLACYGELGQLDGLLARLRSKATQAHQAEIDQHRQLIEAIRETAQANLPVPA